MSEVGDSCKLSKARGRLVGLPFANANVPVLWTGKTYEYARRYNKHSNLIAV